MAGCSRILAACVALLAVGCEQPRPSTDAAPATAPNVLLITIDTLRPDHLGTYGFGLDTSPEIDELARHAVVFERAIAAASATAPAHASILTSRYTREHSVGFRNGATRLGPERTLAELFREAGYATAAFVSNVVLQDRTGLDRGFDVYDAELLESEKNRRHIYERPAEQTTERALAWLRDRGAGPFFLWVHYQDPHGPYDPPAPFDRSFDLPPEPGEAELPVLSDASGHYGIPDYQALEGLRRLSQYRGRYAGEILYADRWIGALVRAVRAHPSMREFILVLTADHGENFGEGDLYLVHGNATTPDQARVPLLVRAPGLPAGRRVEIVSHVDILPTLLELAGLPVPESSSGTALGPWLRGEQPLPDRVVYCDIGHELSAYGDEIFHRVGGVSAAWEGATRAMAPNWASYRWNADGSWSPVRADAGARAPIRAYFARAVPMEKAPRPRREDLEQLRALGYVFE